MLLQLQRMVEHFLQTPRTLPADIARKRTTLLTPVPNLLPRTTNLLAFLSLLMVNPSIGPRLLLVILNLILRKSPNLALFHSTSGVVFARGGGLEIMFI
jgi:hypothetical protein